jgi:hypothetical protein
MAGVIPGTHKLPSIVKQVRDMVIHLLTTFRIKDVFARQILTYVNVFTSTLPVGTARTNLPLKL